MKTFAGFLQKQGIISSLFGTECRIAYLINCISKLKYCLKAGDPTGLSSYLVHKGVECGIIARYVGNRIHILFHLSGIILKILELLKTFLSKHTSSGRLGSAVLGDLKKDALLAQLQALGLVGKFLTGPWMVLFYKNSVNLTNLETGHTYMLLLLA